MQTRRTKRYEILDGYDLNLNFPSVVGSMNVVGRKISYGYKERCENAL